MQWNKEDTKRSNLNCKVISKPNSCPPLLVFIVFNQLTCKVRIDIAVRSPSKPSQAPTRTPELSRLGR